MKGKKLLTLLTLAMGFAIVGGTFAAWAVTDNADPFGIKVSPGQVGPDETKYVTLSYGSKAFANVENLKPGEPRLAGSVILKADTDDGSVFPYGQFDISLTDQTETPKADDAANLIDLLEVKVYNKEVTVDEHGIAVVPKKTEEGHETEEIDPIESILKADEEKKASAKLTIPSDGYKVWVVVSLDGSTDAKDLDEIASDVVYVGMDLNKSSDTPIVESSTIYLVGDPGKSMYCYAWSKTNKNAEWPGKLMNDLSNGYYSYELDIEYETIIFSERAVVAPATEETQVWQTVDLTIGAEQRSAAKASFTKNSTPVQEGETAGKYEGTWSKKPATDLVWGYYLIGDSEGLGAWDISVANLMTKVNDDEYTFEYTFTKGENFKVCNSNKTVWYSTKTPWEHCGFEVDTDGNIVIGDEGVGAHTVHLYLNGENENFVTLGLPVQQG